MTLTNHRPQRPDRPAAQPERTPAPAFPSVSSHSVTALDHAPYSRMVNLTVARLVRHRPNLAVEREDLTQQGWVALLEPVRPFDPSRGSSTSAYLQNQCEVALKEQVRQDGRRRCRELALDAPIGPEGRSRADLLGDPDGTDPESALALLELRTDLAGALGRLSDETQDLVRVRAGLGTSDGAPEPWPAIALRTGLSQATLRARHRSALAQLRTELAAWA